MWRPSKLVMASGVFLLGILALGCDGDKVASTGHPGMGTCLSGCGTPGCPPCSGPGNSTWPVPNAAYIGEIAHPKLRKPVRVAVGPKGEIVVTDPRSKSVHVFSAAGSYRFAIRRVLRPLACAMDGKGRIYVGDSQTRSVRIFDELGNYVGALGKGDGEFSMPNDMAIDPATQTLYVVDSGTRKVVGYGLSTGKLKLSFGGDGDGNGQFRGPLGIVFNPVKKQVVVGDVNKVRIQVFGASGAFVSSFGSTLTQPQGMALDGKQRLYVPDSFQGHVRVLDSAGLHITYVGKAGKGKGQLMIPLDAVIDGYNRLIVTSNLTGKIVLYGIDKYSQPPPDLLRAEIVFEPARLNLSAKGKLVTLYVEVPAKPAAAVTLATARLQVRDTVLKPASHVTKVGDRDGDGYTDTMIKFSMSQVIAAVGAAADRSTLRVKLTAALDTGDSAEGWTEIGIVRRGRRGGSQP